MFKWLKALDERSNKWIQDRAYKKKLAGKGPWIMYRCQKCWGCWFETDILDGTGVCPRCNANRFECAFPSFFENLKAIIRILFGKTVKTKAEKIKQDGDIK